MSKVISRRTVLRGLGAAVSLPLLEGMLPLGALAQSAIKPKANRMAFLFVPNGMNMEFWTPTTEGANFALPSTLEPLAGLRGKFSVLSGLAQHNAFDLGDGPGDHARSTACFLTGVHPKKTSGADIHNGISVDQLAAQKVGDNTTFASLELGCERGALAGDCDSGYSCAYSSSISWRSATTPVAKEINPRLVFERLFGTNAGTDAESFMRRQYKKSILDFVLEDAAALKSRLGLHDQRKVDEYLAGIREIEQRMAKLEKSDPASAAGPKPDGIPRDFGEHVKLMGDMMVLAFQADLTRISTFMLANDGSNRSYSQIGVPEGHHDVSHHGRDPIKLAKKQKIDRYHLELLAYILGRMESVKELDGSLLDNSMVVFGAGISDGDRHNHDNLPILIAGGGGGKLKVGGHTRFAPNTPLNNLYLSLLDRMGVHAETLGDSTGTLRELL